MTRLEATTHEDPLPEGDLDSGFAAWLAAAGGPTWPDRSCWAPFRVRVPLNPETLESVQCDGYRRDKIVFDSEEDMSVPAYLLVPDGRTEPGSAVLAIHGHGPGKSQVVGLEHTDMPNADYGLQLVRRGYVVLAPDLRCFGERADWNPPDHYGCDTNLVHAVMAGWRPLTQSLWDMSRCLDFLGDHPLVDAEPASGMVGLSYGGTITLFTGRLRQPGGRRRGPAATSPPGP